MKIFFIFILVLFVYLRIGRYFGALAHTVYKTREKRNVFLQYFFFPFYTITGEDECPNALNNLKPSKELYSILWGFHLLWLAIFTTVLPIIIVLVGIMRVASFELGETTLENFLKRKLLPLSDEDKLAKLSKEKEELEDKLIDVKHRISQLMSSVEATPYR